MIRVEEIRNDDQNSVVFASCTRICYNNIQLQVIIFMFVFYNRKLRMHGIMHIADR